MPDCIFSKPQAFIATPFNKGKNPGGTHVKQLVFTNQKHIGQNTSKISCITLDELADCITFKEAILKVDVEDSKVDRFLHPNSPAAYLERQSFL